MRRSAHEAWLARAERNGLPLAKLLQQRLEEAVAPVEPVTIRPADCKHPVNRRVGKTCMACGVEVRG